MNNQKNASTMMDIALIAIFAALITAFSLLPAINLSISPVPITLQTFAICLAGMVLGPYRGALAVLLYLFVGFAGLPVFAGWKSGIAVLSGPSAGYLISFPLVALVVGLLSHWSLRRGLATAVATFVVAGIIGSLLVCHPLGIIGMKVNLGLSWAAAVKVDLPFIIGDLLKAVLAAVVAVPVHKVFPALAVNRSRYSVANA